MCIHIIHISATRKQRIFKLFSFAAEKYVICEKKLISLPASLLNYYIMKRKKKLKKFILIFNLTYN